MIVTVLGQELSRNEPHPELRARIDVGLAAFRSLDASYLVCSGGRTNEDVPRAECDVMKEYAIDRGIDPDRILTERRSQDTIGNGYFTRLLVEDLDWTTETVALVTSDYHADRAAYVFEQCFGSGYSIETSFSSEPPAPADSQRAQREAQRMERTRAFFEAIPAGELEAIRRRLLRDHAWYESEPAILAR